MYLNSNLFINYSKSNNFIASCFETLNCNKTYKRNIICKSTFQDGNAEFGKNSSNFHSFQKTKNSGLQNSMNINFSQEDNKNQKNILKPGNIQKSLFNQNSRLKETSKQQVVSITYEEIGLFPRSFNRVFDRFFKQLFFDVENLVIQEYRFYRYLFLTTVKCLFILIFVPLGINFISKNYLIRPVTEYYWNTHNHEIFLNSYQQKRAFTELRNFEEKIYFESLLLPENQFLFGASESKSTNFPNVNPSKFINTFDLTSSNNLNEKSSSFNEKNLTSNLQNQKNEIQNITGKNKNLSMIRFSPTSQSQTETEFETKNLNSFGLSKDGDKKMNLSTLFTNSIQKRLQIKIFELANHYNQESIEAVTNFFADVLSFSCLCFLLFRLEIQINITKSFLLEVFFGLDDSKKSLLILFITDLLVGYHSPNIWELFFQTLFDHYGLPESQTTIFLLVATLPVLLDVLFKYLIFRHLNRASPATVATYHAMIE
nr:envelope membrane protein [Scenedesmaceae sp. YH-2023b]